MQVFNRTIHRKISHIPTPTTQSQLERRRVYLWPLACLLFLLSDNAFAAQDIQALLINASRVIAPLTLMVLVISNAAGIWFIMTSVIAMKKFGVISQTQHGEFSGPLVKLAVGTALLFLPTMADVSMTSLFGQTASIFSGGTLNYGAVGTGSDLLSYTASAGVEQHWASLANVLVLYMKFLGFLSFVKGWFIIGKTGAPGAQPGMMGKGLTHIIGGIALINIVGLARLLRNTFGF